MRISLKDFFQGKTTVTSMPVFGRKTKSTMLQKKRVSKPVKVLDLEERLYWRDSNIFGKYATK